MRSDKTKLILPSAPEQMNRLFTHIIKILNLMNSSLDHNIVLQTIMDSAKIVLNSEASSLMLIDEATNELYFNVVTGAEARLLKQIRVPIGQGIAGIVAQSGQPLLVNDAQNDPRVFKEVDRKTDHITKNLLAVPMKFQDQMVGVLEVVNSLGRVKFEENDLELLLTFADQATLVIQNRELINALKSANTQLNKKLRELSTLHGVGKVLNSTINKQELFDAFVKILSRELETQNVSILLFSKKKHTLEVVSYVGKKPSVHHFEKNFSKNLYANSKKSLLVPLTQEGNHYGAIHLEAQNGASFSDDTLRLLVTISNQLAQGIQNFDLLDEILKKQAYEKELEITSSFQRSILPQKKPRNNYYDVGFVSQPAKATGGDFYDFFQVTRKNNVFVIADVSGKSLPAALFMAVTNSIIRTIGRFHELSTSEILSRANDLIYENSRSGMFVTLFYSIYDPYTHKYTYSSAGHNEQLLYRQDKNTFEALKCSGSPLGVLPSTPEKPYGMKSVYLRIGDVLVLYTDGVSEALNASNQEFGIERLKEIIQEFHFMNPNQLAQKIWDEIEDFVGATEQFDDITIMIIKILN